MKPLHEVAELIGKQLSEYVPPYVHNRVEIAGVVRRELKSHFKHLGSQLRDQQKLVMCLGDIRRRLAVQQATLRNASGVWNPDGSWSFQDGSHAQLDAAYTQMVESVEKLIGGETEISRMLAEIDGEIGVIDELRAAA